MTLSVKTLLSLTTVMILMNACQPRTEMGNECSIKSNGVNFTRSLNNAAENAKVEASSIVIKSEAKLDFFNDPDGKLSNNTAPVLITLVDNTKPFTFNAKVTPVFKTTYDAGAMYIYVDGMMWNKFAFEQDERGRHRIVSVRTMDTSDDNNHDVIDRESVYLKISSDTKTVGFYYSTDNETWNLARLYKNNYPGKIGLGISSQSPTGDGNITTFKNCSLSDKPIKDFRMGI